MRILLLEHCPDIQLVLANDGEEAVAFVRREGAHMHAPTPTLVLVSLDVPRMDGAEIVRKVRQSVGKAKPIIVFADLTDEWTVANCYKAGASCVLPKPFDLEDYIATLKYAANLWGEAVPAASKLPYELLATS